jgi:SAM-dependent methyltransferase
MCNRRPNPRESPQNATSAAERALTDRVRQFYEQFHFPGVRPPDQDGLILMRRLAGCLGGSRGEPQRSRVLDAGCGTGNTVISLARRFTDVDFLGIDISASSLSIAAQAAQEAGLRNIRFRRWDLLERNLGEGLFDVVLCLGVLHHTANGEAALRNLREATTEDGIVFLWVYGQHGRYRHSLNVRLLSMLLSAGPLADDPVGLAREFALNGGRGAVAGDLLAADMSAPVKERILREPAWIADQFLNPNEVLFTMESLLPLLRSAGLQIERWLGLPEAASSQLGSDVLRKRFETMDRDRQMMALDLLLKPDRYFLSLRRPQEIGSP